MQGSKQIRNLKQLVAFVTGKETRIGYPNEHLGSESKDAVVSPMYATGVGLVLKGFEHAENLKPQKPMIIEPEDENIGEEIEDEVGKEPTLIDRISGWFTEENID